MEIVELNQAISDEERAERLFSGQLLVFRNLPAMHQLVDYSDTLIREFTGLLEPTTSQQHLTKEQFLETMGNLQMRYKKDLTARGYFFKALQQAGVKLSEAYYDHFPIRVVPYDKSHNGAHRAAIGHHRDTWGSNIHCQQNWWAPIYRLTEQRTIAFYPHYWDTPLANNTDSWSFEEYLELRNNSPSERHIDYPSAPRPSELIDESGVVKVVINPGDLLAFSSAHLHASVPNDSDKARFSVEMRTIHQTDLLFSRTAPNVDNAASTPMFGWFRSIEDDHKLSEYIQRLTATNEATGLLIN